MTNFEKAKEFVERNKKAIIAGTLTGTSMVIGILLYKKLSFFKAEVTTLPKKIINNNDFVMIIPDNLKTCDMTALWREGDYVNSIVNNVCLSQMGEFGVELIDNLDCIEPDVPVDLIIGFLAK